MDVTNYKGEVMNKEIREMRLNGVEVAFTPKEVVETKLNHLTHKTISKAKLSFNEAIYLRDTLIEELAEMGEPVYFSSEYICTTELLDCHFEIQHDCS